MEQYERLVAEITSYFKGEDVKSLFCHGGCFYFANLLAKHLNGAVIMWNHQLMHCAICYEQGLYDFTGRISKKGFIEADEKALQYMKKHFKPDFDERALNVYLEQKMFKTAA